MLGERALSIVLTGRDHHRNSCWCSGAWCSGCTLPVSGHSPRPPHVCTVQCGTVRYSAVQCGTVRYSAAWGHCTPGLCIPSVIRQPRAGHQAPGGPPPPPPSSEWSPPAPPPWPPPCPRCSRLSPRRGGRRSRLRLR